MEVVKLSKDFMDEFYEKHPEFKDAIEAAVWCECEEETDDVIFHHDNQLAWENCVEKHHFHCGLCLKINQIG